MENNIGMSNKRNKIIFIILGFAVAHMYFIPFARQNFYTQMKLAMDLSDPQIGTLASIYGLVCLFCYIPSGILADKYKANVLMLISFITSGILTLWHATFPSYNVLMIIYAGLGVTTIVFFWSPYLKILRCLFSESEQGKSYGLNESLKWLFSAIIAFISLQIMNMIPDDVEGYRMALIFSGVLYFVLGFVLYKIVPSDIDGKQNQTKGKGEKVKGGESTLVRALKLPGTWKVTIIIFCAYMLYSMSMYLTPYFVDIGGLDPSTASTIGIVRSYVISIFAVGVGGILSDRAKSRVRMDLLLFGISLVMCIILLMLDITKVSIVVSVSLVCLTTFIIFSFRGLYWSTQEELGVPIELTGTVTGIASILAYSPDAFYPKLAGEILDKNPGVEGYQMLFMIACVMCILGMLITGLILMNIKKKNSKNQKVKGD